MYIHILYISRMHIFICLYISHLLSLVTALTPISCLAAELCAFEQGPPNVLKVLQVLCKARATDTQDAKPQYVL